MTKENLGPNFVLLQMPESLLIVAGRMASDAEVSLEKFLLSAIEERVTKLKEGYTEDSSG